MVNEVNAASVEETPTGNLQATLDDAGLKNTHVREHVRYWAELTGVSRVEVVGASDDARLIKGSLAAGEIAPAGEGRYYARSYVKDTARSEERTVVATANPADKGVYNNWRHSGEMRPVFPVVLPNELCGCLPIRSCLS